MTLVPPNTNPGILVTGASRGLGRGIAVHCARLGADVAIHFNENQDSARETIRLCQEAALHPAQKFVMAGGNLASTRDRASIFEHTISQLGRLDALINNAGMAPRARADITATTEENYDEVMAVNLKGPFFLSQLAARHWLAHPGQSRLSGGYKLIFITSISADIVSVNRGEYCLSKAGLAMACQLWSARLAGEGAQVFEIRPGIMETDMTATVKEKYNALIADGVVPQKRWGTPDDIGLAVAAILKGQFPFSTGQVIMVDGGLHLKQL
jgi:NAD(P)-dependent dehydrogenase (short-subunit alcohol dehydrogenase family)